MRLLASRWSGFHAAMLAVTAGVLMPLGGCKDDPTGPQGQVVAVVNGSEITTSELQAEAEATGADLRRTDVRNQLLQTIVQRHLQATAAIERGLDKDPRFLAQKRRAEQQILAQMFLLSTRAGAGEADVGAARTFVLENPHLFEDRQIMIVDRLGFAPARALSKAEIDAVKTLSDAQRLLEGKGIRFDRKSATVDPADLPPEMALGLAELAPGKVFFANTGDVGMFATILERKSSPVSPERQLGRAREILTRRRQEEALRSAVEGLRKRAKVTYQQGYGPIGSAPASAAAAAKK